MAVAPRPDSAPPEITAHDWAIESIRHSEFEAEPSGDFDTDTLVKPKAYIVLKQGYEPSEELANELKNYVKERLAAFKYPRWIEFLPELPKTATGKIQRFVLRGTAETEKLG